MSKLSIMELKWAHLISFPGDKASIIFPALKADDFTRQRESSNSKRVKIYSKIIYSYIQSNTGPTHVLIWCVIFSIRILRHADVIFILFWSTETWTTSQKVEKNQGYFEKPLDNSFRVSARW